MTDRINLTENEPPTADEIAQSRRWLRTLGYSDHQIDWMLKRWENDRQERVRRSLGSHGPWGGER